MVSDVIKIVELKSSCRYSIVTAVGKIIELKSS